MDFDHTEEQTLLRNLIEKYTADHYDPVRRLAYVRTQNGFSSQGWQILADMGILAFPFSEDIGGFGGGHVELIIIMEALGKGVATDPVLSVLLIAGGLIEEAGTDTQKTQVLPALISGEKFLAFAHFEHASRFDATVINTRAEKTSSGWILNGNKQLVLAAPFANQIIVSATDQDDATGLYLVDCNAEGACFRHYRMVDGAAASNVEFINTPAEPMNGGPEEISKVISNARLAICAELMGLMEQMFEATLEYVKTRNQFGQPIGRFQVIQHRMADNYKRLELCRSQLYRVVTQRKASTEWETALAGAKAYISENALRLAEECIQLHGGIGTTEELMVGQAFKRVLVLSTLFGDSDFELQQYIAFSAED